MIEYGNLILKTAKLNALLSDFLFFFALLIASIGYFGNKIVAL
jgi:hypothetical protein